MVKTLADYIHWRNKPSSIPPVDEYRPPVPLVNYDKLSTQFFSKLDNDPVINRVLRAPKVTVMATSLPIVNHPAFLFVAGALTGFSLTYAITSHYVGRKEIENLVKFDPRYFPEYTKSS
uniref:Uncharacterized protein n=1 Tax=Polytomella parva TaxID=51329 RepID=A0A7S0VJV3_9CHLO|nr:Chain s, NUOP7 [Polytomella sp. Pringsheim 198.80]7ARD_s Chain s, NUOP7 [Polytomella sp. Pringsheim 198.80]|mmetsp:Transcript_7456/g.14670  ORF Transcript_7456/g.14670 Transcript_7456/m.14670 type:complete len:119 (+) Transcript_7456:61-417(+)|eukprot:CAMPEP_0175064370 /NCGR_PEP_ID=MMETSP0052_2-20121109/15292_1 /TAXON_ID=51329 ORGANISM="Polytomella parva, Strain SAG 63-3" /NCGR_SAMPLE_ID=MMETSP0052_2 /ASSEMBLY_ACC=CAM_ASM_000194 /LENGTH=118 /DNA_ID=CAMNT_0016330707 /DNA_START=26 /DNA_END=382 /DNA_ORIENTATION=-